MHLGKVGYANCFRFFLGEGGSLILALKFFIRIYYLIENR
jgi:hypothetical protein